MIELDFAVDQHPELAERGSLGHLRLGRIKPPEGAVKLKLATYLNPDALPPRPRHIDYISGVPEWPMYGNDSLGDCTWAAVGHMEQAWAAKLGGEIVPSEADIEQGYWETGDPPAATGVAGGATDYGRVETDVLRYWRKNGIPNEGHKILAYAEVEHHHFRVAAWLFGGLYIGLQLPLTAESQQVWDYVPDDPDNQPGSWGGHAVPILAYDRRGFVVITWGFQMRMTNLFRTTYCDQAYAIITEEWLDAAGVSLAGFNLAQLQTDLASMTGQSSRRTTVGAVGADLPAEETRRDIYVAGSPGGRQ